MNNSTPTPTALQKFTTNMLKVYENPNIHKYFEHIHYNRVDSNYVLEHFAVKIKNGNYSIVQSSIKDKPSDTTEKINEFKDFLQKSTPEGNVIGSRQHELWIRLTAQLYQGIEIANQQKEIEYRDNILKSFFRENDEGVQKYLEAYDQQIIDFYYVAMSEQNSRRRTRLPVYKTFYVASTPEGESYHIEGKGELSQSDFTEILSTRCNEGFYTFFMPNVEKHVLEKKISSSTSPSVKPQHKI